MIDWHSQTSEVLINPRLPLAIRNALISTLEDNNHLNHLPGHVWIATSGSSGESKFVALSKEAILASAAAVNRHLQSNRHDVWLNPLPMFHVGGLGISARCFLSGATLVSYLFKEHKWNPGQYVDQLNTSKATLSSMVPTQIFDIIALKLSPPPSLRAVIVGGGVLSQELYFKAIEMGWNLLPSYGLTECSSQVATASLESLQTREYPRMKPLDHVTLSLTDEHFLKIKSPALLTGYLSTIPNKGLLHHPKVDGWFITEDIGELQNGEIISVKRGEHFIKIAGESIDLIHLERVLESIMLSTQSTFDAALVALPDERLGHAIHLAVVQSDAINLKELVRQFDLRVLPVARIKQVHHLTSIPRSSLNKILRKQLQEILS